ncbi:AraC family transcriptional regulator [Chitinophaga lutea]|uniref:AraC family transcriptional regulator n=1 Tax=Chitinophaga lutea TaxID=2488634 RepID=A0A3N4PGR1_9BACT|nr:helix-turn-helix transcriptional regulator [Chitinophaga lutea]RPE05719.1 AraC family transcriptional regulator [Chitinophaga lutea]
MEFRQIPPPDALKNHIRYFWVLEGAGADIPSKSFRTMADGCPGLIFQHPDLGVMYQNNKALPGIFVYGPATKYAEIRLAGAFSTIGIFFYPNALPAIFGLNAGELTDTCMDLDLLAQKEGFPLAERLSAAPSAQDRMAILCTFLMQQIRENSRFEDAAIQHALSHIIQSKGSVPMKQLQEQLQLSERSFERKFKQYVGVSPKLFARISRFQASLSQLRNNDFCKLSDLAFDNDYADQSHFIRSFREFAGFSPHQLRKQSVELLENFTELK